MNSGFFDSVSFGLLATILTGASWCVIGLIMSDAPKRGVRSDYYQYWAAIIVLIVAVLCMTFAGGWTACEPKYLLLVLLNDTVACTLNFFMMHLMSKAMQIGPNGAIWGIIQSAVIAPFAMGMICFDTTPTPARFCGLGALILGLIFFSMTKNTEYAEKNSRWRIYTFTAFCLTCIQQCMTNLPTYYPWYENVNSIFRCIGSSAGAFVGFHIYAIFKNIQSPGYFRGKYTSLKNGQLWKYLILGQLVGLPVSFALFYPGMKILSANKMGSLSYPLVICACILSFTIVTIIHMKEKMSKAQFLALVCCIAGIALFCLGSNSH